MVKEREKRRGDIRGNPPGGPPGIPNGGGIPPVEKRKNTGQRFYLLHRWIQYGEYFKRNGLYQEIQMAEVENPPVLGLVAGRALD